MGGDRAISRDVPRAIGGTAELDRIARMSVAPSAIPVDVARTRGVGAGVITGPIVSGCSRSKLQASGSVHPLNPLTGRRKDPYCHR